MAEFVASSLHQAALRLADAASRITGKIVDQVATLMEPGDIIIDGGNSY